MSTVPTGGASQGLENLRDVGGLPASGGRRVRRGQLYRSDAPILGDAVPTLHPWPPRTVIDLRSRGEAGAATHPLAPGGAHVFSVPLLPELSPARQAQVHDAGHPDLATTYRRLIRIATERLIEVARIVATEPAPVLLHCAAGKDRTGVAMAVLLAAVGVPRDDIVADYVRSDDSVARLPERLALGWSEGQREAVLELLTVRQPELLRTSVAAIDAVLDALEAWSGGASGWLVAHGLSADELKLLNGKLTVAEAGRHRSAPP